MSFWKRLFGGGTEKPAAEPIEYEGFLITPQPIAEDGGYRISAVIEGEVGGETKTHTLIRADVLRDPDDAAEASVAKAKQMIDQTGAGLFDA
ncbi:HlyU family transcriptional regulator [Sagittula salina]|uniref:Transcriptional activator HlyU n=1 Tax=Sagittula salina TaxID=2820268 RepID=A0A940S1E6_9RHOB|nr:HlyU family transcriptional regulator [Sagittula salina]MBP0484068.1 hypothetical protein [Sagittula salina]